MITHAQEIANEADRICYIFDGMLTEGKQEERSE